MHITGIIIASRGSLNILGLRSLKPNQVVNIETIPGEKSFVTIVHETKEKSTIPAHFVKIDFATQTQLEW